MKKNESFTRRQLEFLLWTATNWKRTAYVPERPPFDHSPLESS